MLSINLRYEHLVIIEFELRPKTFSEMGHIGWGRRHVSAMRMESGRQHNANFLHRLPVVHEELKPSGILHLANSICPFTWVIYTPVQTSFCKSSSDKFVAHPLFVWLGTLSAWSRSIRPELPGVRCIVFIITFCFTFETWHWWQTAYMFVTVVYFSSATPRYLVLRPCDIRHSGRCRVLISNLVDFHESRGKQRTRIFWNFPHFSVGLWRMAPA